MLKPNTFTSFLLIIAGLVFTGVSTSAQVNVSSSEASYEATLYVLIGSDDDAQRGELPKPLSGVAKQIRDTFTFRNYRLMNTYYGRLANNGSLDYKSVSSLKNVSTELDSPSFLDWQLANFKTETTGSGRNSLSVQLFRFGARVPIVISQLSSGDGKSVPLTNYESVGLTLNRLSIAENDPTLIGTISLPRTTGTVFLVLAIKRA
jgi:hypothetical protein